MLSVINRCTNCENTGSEPGGDDGGGGGGLESLASLASAAHFASGCLDDLVLPRAAKSAYASAGRAHDGNLSQPSLMPQPVSRTASLSSPQRSGRQGGGRPVDGMDEGVDRPDHRMYSPTSNAGVPYPHLSYPGHFSPSHKLRTMIASAHDDETSASQTTQVCGVSPGRLQVPLVGTAS